MAKANALRIPQPEASDIKLFRGGPNPLYTTTLIGSLERIGALHQMFYAGVVGAPMPQQSTAAPTSMTGTNLTPARKKRTVSAATRKLLAEKSKLRWAKQKAGKKTMTAGG
jgi:hypothetical protein